MARLGKERLSTGGVMSNIFNKSAHFFIGIFVGVRSDKPSAPLVTAAFLSYQAIEVQSKHDKGYPEIKEFGIGLGIGLLIKALIKWMNTKS